MKKSNPRLKLNPNFKAAHDKNQNDPWENLEKDLNSATNGMTKVSFQISQARKNGKLSLSNAGLTTLPQAMFEIRNDLLDKYTGNIDEQNQLQKHEKAWECYGEEMLTTVS